MLFDDPQAPVDGLTVQRPGELRRYCQDMRRVLASQARHDDFGTGFRRVGTDVGPRLSKFDRKILVELEFILLNQASIDRTRSRASSAARLSRTTETGIRVPTKQAVPWQTPGSTEMYVRQSMRPSMVSEIIASRR